MKNYLITSSMNNNTYECMACCHACICCTLKMARVHNQILRRLKQ